MPEGKEAKIKVILDVDDAKRGLRDLNAEGQRAANTMGGGGAGGGGTRGGASGASGVRGAAGGAAAARAAPSRAAAGAGGGGGLATAAAGAARGMGIRGMGMAALAATAMAPVGAMGAGFMGGVMGRSIGSGAAIGGAIGGPIGSMLDEWLWGENAPKGRAHQSALEATKAAWGYAVGLDPSAQQGASAYFGVLREMRMTEQLGMRQIERMPGVVESAAELTGGATESLMKSGLFGVLASMFAEEIGKVAEDLYRKLSGV